jgi:hypothetical protein
MILQERIAIMARLGEYMGGNDENWLAAKERAGRENPWFLPEFIEQSVGNIADRFLKADLLENWAKTYAVPDRREKPALVGLVMAGNIPLVGFHDLLCVFISGHRCLVKPSSKDEILIRHLAGKLAEWSPEIADLIGFADRLTGCDAYIATGSNNTSRYFEFYFGKYPNIIRRNRTSVAILTGNETKEELDALAGDIQSYFGLGCRNVTKLYVPRGYDFIPLLDALRRYDYFMDAHKYRHNFDYHLALLIMGNRFYMSNDAVILTENVSAFSPVSQVHYEYYDGAPPPASEMAANSDIQCVVGKGLVPFGAAQQPELSDYADGVDTMAFLSGL